MNMKIVGDKIHSYNSNCIYSVVNLMGTLLGFLMSNANKRAVGLIPAQELAH